MPEPIHPTRSRARITAENRAELDGWLDERAQELAARGVPLDEARQRAREEFGDVGQAARYADQQDVVADGRVRVVLWAQDLAADLRIAVRALSRTPTVTAVVLLTFALGIGATTAVFSLVYAMLLRPLPFGEEARLAYLPAVDDGVIRPGRGGARHSAAALVALRERTTSFSGIAGVSVGNGVLRGNGDPEQLWMAEVTQNAFDVLEARAVIGRTFRPSETSGPASDGVVVLLDGLWRRRFGADSGVIGRIIDFGNERREVVGVMPPGFHVPTYQQAELLAPLDIDHFARNPNTSQVRFVRLFARVKRGISLQVAQADLDRAMHTLQSEFPRSFERIETRLMPIRAAVAGDARPRLFVLMGAALFVLLIAVANVAGILLARAIARRHELSLRVALGAGRLRLIRQFLAEGVVLATFGTGLGLLIAQLGIVALRKIATTALPQGFDFSLEPQVLVFAVGAAIFAAMASALFPALGATRALGIALRRDDTRASTSRANRRMRLALVAGQLAVSVVLLVGAGLFLTTLHRLAVLDLGYVTEHALTFRPQFMRPKSNAEQDAHYASLYAELRAIPGVISVGGGSVPTSGESTVIGLAIDGRPVDETRLPDVRYTPASDDYFATLRIPVLRGRIFTPADRDGAPWVAVVSAGLAKQLWPNGDPIGARVRVEASKPWATVVGVVGDVRMGGADTPQPSVYTSQRQDYWRGGSWVVLRATGDPAALAASVREAVRRVDPTLVLGEGGTRTLEEFRRSTPAIADRRLQMQLMLAFALVALIVSAIGVYGVGAYAMEARRHEFGIRMALGASRRGVLWLALREGASVAVIGAFVGVPLALMLAWRMRDLLFATAPYDPLTVAAALGALIVVVFAASLVPARRATLVDPAKAMRAD